MDDEESSEEDGGKEKYLMAHIDVPVTDKESKGSSTFEVDMAKSIEYSKIQDWDSLSLYQHLKTPPHPVT
ncbi:unnamed protein product [Lactuca virosa]|uniref:Uncharacterized protein n=1 Tax=Lactuca virosa TaxID=75947 RepID=A0AAU9MFE8_9ASTR|nr:unnamed protein product [Lactuca virosa]